MRLDRRAFVGGIAAAAAGPTWATEPPSDATYADDFDELWLTLGARYCFFAEKRTDWAMVRVRYRPLAIAAPSDEAFTEIVRQVLAELYDPHTHLSNPPDGTPRWPLYDLMAEHGVGGVRIVAVHADSAAAHTGLAIGDVVTRIDGRPAATVVGEMSPRCLSRADPAAAEYACNVAVAGRRGQARRFTVASPGLHPRAVTLPLTQRAVPSDVDHRRLAKGFGYIAIRSFGGAAVVDAVDRALADLRDAPGLILDVRDNGGGDTAVARPIMGRFIAARKPYARMRRRDGPGLSAPWTESVDPRGPFTVTVPVVVLTNRWSASMAEGFPMGMRGIGRATIVGTPMMGLGAAVFPLRLDRTGIAVQYSAEPVYDVAGRPRWLMRPDIMVRDGDDILAAGIAAFA